MTIDEAIKHEEELAEEKENNAKNYPRPNKSIKGSGRKYNAYLKCAEEHKQLAEWLKDYKRLLEQQPCIDAISREEAIKPFLVDATEEWTSADIVKYIKSLLSVHPKQEDILDKIQAELYANAELHEDGDYYLREEWIGEIFDKYKAESEEKK